MFTFNKSSSNINLYESSTRITTPSLCNRKNGTTFYTPLLTSRSEVIDGYGYLADAPTLCVRRDNITYYGAKSRTLPVQFMFYEYANFGDNQGGKGSVNLGGNTYYYCSTPPRYTKQFTVESPFTYNVSSRQQYVIEGNIYYQLKGYYFGRTYTPTNITFDVNSSVSLKIDDASNLYYFDLYTKLSDYVIPAGTYTPNVFLNLIQNYVSLNSTRVVSSSFSVKVNGQTATVPSGSTIYNFKLGTSPWDAQFIGFGVKTTTVDWIRNNYFSTYKTYCVQSNQVNCPSSVSDVFNKYADYPITVVGDIKFA